MPNPEHGNMVRDSRDVWPDDEPIGSFDIDTAGVQGDPRVKAHILFICPNAKRCGVMLGTTPQDRRDPDDYYVWGWDGNIEKPTITPSINCIAEKDGKPTGGCGWHGFITNGVIK